MPYRSTRSSIGVDPLACARWTSSANLGPSVEDHCHLEGTPSPWARVRLLDPQELNVKARVVMLSPSGWTPPPASIGVGDAVSTLFVRDCGDRPMLLT